MALLVLRRLHAGRKTLRLQLYPGQLEVELLEDRTHPLVDVELVHLDQAVAAAEGVGELYGGPGAAQPPGAAVVRAETVEPLLEAGAAKPVHELAPHPEGQNGQEEGVGRHHDALDQSLEPGAVALATDAALANLDRLQRLSHQRDGLADGELARDGLVRVQAGKEGRAEGEERRHNGARRSREANLFLSM